MQKGNSEIINKVTRTINVITTMTCHYTRYHFEILSRFKRRQKPT